MSDTVTIPTSELEGAALDWAVARAVGHAVSVNSNIPWGRTEPDGPAFVEHHVDEPWPGADSGVMPWRPSTDWSQGGPLIRVRGARIGMELRMAEGSASFLQSGMRIGYTANDVLVAACRAIVAAHLGDSVQVPAELVGGSHG